MTIHWLQLVGVILEEDRLQRGQERQVQSIEPYHRFVTPIIVVVPVPDGRQDQVARFHVTCITVDGRIDARTCKDEANGAGRMPVRRCRFMWPQVLERTPECRTR